jgi:hypothetical protein
MYALARAAGATASLAAATSDTGSSKLSKYVAWAVLIFAVVMGARSCAKETQLSSTDGRNASADAEQALETNSREGERAAPAPTGEQINVASDPNATYHLLGWRMMPNGNREALTRREGPSGISFARREIDCDAPAFRYIGEGDDLASALEDGPNPAGMASLVTGSISDVIVSAVCAKPRAAATPGPLGS